MILCKFIDCLKNITLIIDNNTIPTPDQIAYAIPISNFFKANVNILKLKTQKISITTACLTFEKPSDNFIKVVPETSNIIAKIK